MTPPPVSIGAMNHIALPTTDPERGAEFYCRVLGFVATPRPAFSFRGAWLLHREVGVMLHLIHDEKFQPNLEAPINSRTNHLAIHVDDFDAAVAQLTLHNIEHVVRVLPTYHYRQVFFRDPDGNVIELGEWPSQEEMFPAESRRECFLTTKHTKRTKGTLLDFDRF